jgi:cyclopropane-fatty-acyl-phospholipid synthase
MTRTSRDLLYRVLKSADIRPNGDRPWDMQIRNERVFDRVLGSGNLGLGEAYMDGWWDTEDLTEFISRLIKVDAEALIRKSPKNLLHVLSARLVNYGAKAKAFEVAERHYDLDHHLFEAMLDKRMTYSCGYWANADSLDEAQENKLDLVCRKIGLRPGMKVLDIGCGWGSFMKYAAERYGVSCVGVSVSDEQTKIGREMCAGLPIEFRVQDYRDMDGHYDRVVSIAMFEQVGYKNMKVFFRLVRRVLADDGLFLLHTLGLNISTVHGDPWNDKYVFPNGMVPSIKHIGESIERVFVMEDWHNFGADYERTLQAWYQNFRKAWPVLKNRYDERFFRMWTYYLRSCAGVIRARYMQLWQIVLSPQGVPGGYRRVSDQERLPSDRDDNVASDRLSMNQLMPETR